MAAPGREILPPALEAKVLRSSLHRTRSNRTRPCRRGYLAPERAKGPPAYSIPGERNSPTRLRSEGAQTFAKLRQKLRAPGGLLNCDCHQAGFFPRLGGARVRSDRRYNPTAPSPTEGPRERGTRQERIRACPTRGLQQKSDTRDTCRGRRP